MIKFYPPLFLSLLFIRTLAGYSEYDDLLQPPYPPPPLFEQYHTNNQTDTLYTVDDIATLELGPLTSHTRDKQEYHRRLLASIESSEPFFHLHDWEGYLIPTPVRNESITRAIDRKISVIFDNSMRRIYYAGYGCETLEETLCDHEELQSTLSKYYPKGIPLESERLQAYFKAMAFGYREPYIDKIEKLRAERLTVVEVSKEENEEPVRPGINPLRIIYKKGTDKPVALWKAGTDKYYGKFILMARGGGEKLYELESAKLEMGYISTWNELLAQALNYLYKGCFLTPTVARFGNTTLHAYHRNQGALSDYIKENKESLETAVLQFDQENIQRWGLMQFLMSSSDSHRGNSLVDKKHLILIDFGRALGLAHPSTAFQLRTTAFDFPQMKEHFSPSDRKIFEMDMTDRFLEFVAGIEQFERRAIVRKQISENIHHLKRNLMTLHLATHRNLTPYQMFRLKYPTIDLQTHLELEALFAKMHKKDVYSSDVTDREIRQVLTAYEIFKRSPFLKAYQKSENDDALFEMLIDRELEAISKECDFGEIELGWLIKGSLIIPLFLKPFF